MKKIVIWPACLDATKTRKEGRKFRRKEAVKSPKIKIMKDIAEKIKEMRGRA